MEVTILKQFSHFKWKRSRKRNLILLPLIVPQGFIFLKWGRIKTPYLWMSKRKSLRHSPQYVALGILKLRKEKFLFLTNYKIIRKIQPSINLNWSMRQSSQLHILKLMKENNSMLKEMLQLPCSLFVIKKTTSNS